MASTDARIEDIGPKPKSFEIERATRQNPHYRSVAWSGRYMQPTAASTRADKDDAPADWSVQPTHAPDKHG